MLYGWRLFESSLRPDKPTFSSVQIPSLHGRLGCCYQCDVTLFGARLSLSVSQKLVVRAVQVFTRQILSEEMSILDEADVPAAETILMPAIHSIGAGWINDLLVALRSLCPTKSFCWPYYDHSLPHERPFLVWDGEALPLSQWFEEWWGQFDRMDWTHLCLWDVEERFGWKWSCWFNVVRLALLLLPPIGLGRRRLLITTMVL